MAPVGMAMVVAMVAVVVATMMMAVVAAVWSSGVRRARQRYCHCERTEQCCC